MRRIASGIGAHLLHGKLTLQIKWGNGLICTYGSDPSAILLLGQDHLETMHMFSHQVNNML